MELWRWVKAKSHNGAHSEGQACPGVLQQTWELTVGVASEEHGRMSHTSGNVDEDSLNMMNQHE